MGFVIQLIYLMTFNRSIETINLTFAKNSAVCKNTITVIISLRSYYITGGGFIILIMRKVKQKV